MYVQFISINKYKSHKILNMKEKMFEKKQFPTLQALAIDVVARNFHLYPELEGVCERTKEIIIQKSIDTCKKQATNLLISAPHIQQEKYWKAICQKQKDKLFPIKLQDHGLSWKVAYIQKYIEKQLERVQSYEKRQAQFIKIFQAINPWVFNLEIRINASDLKLDQICKYLTNIVNLKIKCSEGKNTDYKKKIVGIRFTQARDISEILRTTQSLLSINLSGNLIDNDLFKTISPGLLLNTTLVQLNLSYNNIGDQGAKKIAKYLLKNKVLTQLNLASNNIRYDGSRYISQALKLNTTIDYLNLKLNSIDDKGGAKFFKDLIFNTNIKHLNVEANLFSSMTVRKLSLYLQAPNPLKQLHIGSNNFNPDQLNIIADSIPEKICREYFVKSGQTIIKLGE